MRYTQRVAALFLEIGIINKIQAMVEIERRKLTDLCIKHNVNFDYVIMVAGDNIRVL